MVGLKEKLQNFFAEQDKEAEMRRLEEIRRRQDVEVLERQRRKENEYWTGVRQEMDERFSQLIEETQVRTKLREIEIGLKQKGYQDVDLHENREDRPGINNEFPYHYYLHSFSLRFGKRGNGGYITVNIQDDGEILIFDNGGPHQPHKIDESEWKRNIEIIDDTLIHAVKSPMSFPVPPPYFAPGSGRDSG